MEDGIWGESLPMSSAEEALLRDASIIGKMKAPKEASVAKALPKNLPWEEKERLIEANVRERLGRHEADTAVIRDVGEYEAYMRKAIASGSVAVDTETNNSLDPITCKLMGLCLFYEGGKQAYVPVNHVDPKTGKRLPGQLDEAQLKPMLDELQASKTELVYHNASFDMRVIQCQVGTALRCDWDTMVASQLLDENEPASLKAQYMLHIDPTHGKYDIESLFEHEEYAKFNPMLFALYAATDAMMTLRLREWQGREFAKPGNEGLLDCYKGIELPVIPVVKDMELRGVCVDMGFVERLTKKYHRILDEYQPKIDAELAKLKPTVDAWKASDEGKSPAKGAKGKTMADQLSDPINIESPTQLSILVYDILKVPPLEKGKRSVDKNTIPLLLERNDIPLLEVVAERKKFKTLVQNFIDKLPKMINPKTGRMHCSYNQVGTATGRFSCIAEGTPISRPKGDAPIEDVKPGDYVYCFDVKHNKLKLSKVVNIYDIGIRKCIRLLWKSKYNSALKGELVCTPEHMIRTVNRGWVEACDLKPEDSILYVHRHPDKNGISLSANFGQGDAKEEHIWIKENFFGVKGGDMHIHHVDSNRENNDPSNLAIVTPKAHANAHMAVNSIEGGHRCGKYNFTRDEIIKMCEDTNWELTRVPYDLNTLKAWLEDYRVNYILAYTESYSKRSYRKSRYGTLMKNLHLPLNKHNIVYALDLAEGNVSVAAGYFAVTEEEFVKKCDEFEILSNHNVYSIEYLEEPKHVYDIEVEGYHNFIAGELCVHNCSEPNLQQIPSKNHEIRLMFQATTEYGEAPSDGDSFELRKIDDVQAFDGSWIRAKDLKAGDILSCEGNPSVVTQVLDDGDTLRIMTKESEVVS